MEKSSYWPKRISIHLEVNNVCNAYCPMCYDRNYIDSDGEVNSYKRGPNRYIRLDQIQEWFGEEFNKRFSLKKLTICGTESEPSLNPELGQIICYFKNHQRATHVRVSTNGATHDQSWWYRMGRLMSAYKTSVQFIFCIDGIDSSHEVYRLGTSYQNVIGNAQAFIAGGGTAIWQFLVFSHNKDQIEMARNTSSKYGFFDFYLKYTNYFRREGIKNLAYKYHGGEYSLQESSFTGQEADGGPSSKSQITCYSLTSKEIFVDYEGYIYPCSWFKSSLMGSFSSVSSEGKSEIVRQFRSERTNLSRRRIGDILDDTQLWKSLSSSWADPILRPRVCELYCASVGGNTQCSFHFDQTSSILKQSEIP